MQSIIQFWNQSETIHYSVRHWRWSRGPRPPEIMSDHQSIQTQWSDGPPKFSALSKNGQKFEAIVATRGR